MNATETIDTGLVMGRIAMIRVMDDCRLEVTWADGARKGKVEPVDLAPALGSYRIYQPLRNAAELFATARVIEDGYVVAWDGVDLEMSAELLEELAEETMTPREFALFLKRNGLTQEAAAAILGRSRRQVGYYLSPGPVPRVVALACLGYEALVARRRAEAA